jgi:hypothetical protein
MVTSTGSLPGPFCGLRGRLLRHREGHLRQGKELWRDAWTTSLPVVTGQAIPNTPNRAKGSNASNTRNRVKDPNAPDISICHTRSRDAGHANLYCGYRHIRGTETPLILLIDLKVLTELRAPTALMSLMPLRPALLLRPDPKPIRAVLQSPDNGSWCPVLLLPSSRKNAGAVKPPSRFPTRRNHRMVISGKRTPTRCGSNPSLGGVGGKVNVIKGVVPIGAMRKMPFSWQRLHQHAAYADEGAGISIDSCPFLCFHPL